MTSDVSGVAGAVRINQLTMAGLTRAEDHGYRFDATSLTRVINDDQPVTSTGRALNRLFSEHIGDAFVPKANAKAMHVIIQFPKDLVDGDDANAMLHHGRKFAERVFGGQAIFADRVDRDEKSRHVVDIFVAPKYTKTTVHTSKIAVSMTRHLKECAIRWGHPPIPMGIGRALQDELFDYLQHDMGLEGVQRGSAKIIAGPDWKSAEQLRSEELRDLEAQAQIAHDRGREDGYSDGRTAGYRDGTAQAEREMAEQRSQAASDAAAILLAASQQAMKIKDAAEVEGLSKGIADGRAQISAEEEAAAAASRAARDDREAAAAEKAAAEAERAKAMETGMDEGRAHVSQVLLDLAAQKRASEAEQKLAAAEKAAAAKERASAKADALAAAQLAYSHREEALDQRATSIAAREEVIRVESERLAAIKTGIEAWVVGDIVSAVSKGDGDIGFRWRDDEAKSRIRPIIKPFWKDVWENVAALIARMSERAASIEREAKQNAIKIMDAATEAVTTFLRRYEAASVAERDVLSKTATFRAVADLASDPAVAALDINPADGEGPTLLQQAVAAGIVKGVKLPGFGTGHGD